MSGPGTPRPSTLGGAEHSPDDAQAGAPEELSAVLSAAARGDESAWRVVVARYSRRVFALARSRVKSPELAEEVTQSVFATVATRLGSGGYAEEGRFESWLFRVAMNRVRDEARRASRHATPMDPASMPSATVEPGREVGTSARELESLRRAMGALADADREVVELRHHGQMSFKAMAELLNEPLGTLLARHHRALRKLRALLAGEGSPDDSPDDSKEGSSGGSRASEGGAGREGEGESGRMDRGRSAERRARS